MFNASTSSGVALVMVLGVLTVMVMLAVAFAISMRTERLAAGNALDTVRARQLAQVGLARAMGDLTQMMGTNLASASLIHYAYPPWSVTNMFATNAASTNRSFMFGDATNFVPGALWSIATNMDSRVNPAGRWTQIQTVTTNTAGIPSTNIFGRVAYLIINCSGLLDANFAGGVGVAHGVGTNPSEIVLADLPDFTGGGAAAFEGNRAADIRYETLPELAALNAGQFAVYPMNFGVYSYAPAGYWDTNSSTVMTQVNLAGNETALAGRMAEISNAFYRAGFNDSEAMVLYRNLIDYVDGNSEPALFTTCVEAVPMINEIVFSTSSGPGPDDITATVTYELWNPFINPNNNNFLFSCTTEFQSALGNITVVGGPTPVSLAPKSFFSSPPFSNTGNFPSGKPSQFNLKIIGASVQLTNQPVDRLQPNTTLSVTVPLNGNVGVECLDPRFNEDIINLTYWKQSLVQTLGFSNNWTTTELGPLNDGDADMYVANAPLKSVGELGYLVYSNAPWHTVKLYGSQLQRVLDVFAIGTNTTDTYVTNAFRGRVNFTPSGASQALAAVFADMPVDSYPGGPSNRLSWADASIVAAAIAAGSGYTNLSDLGRVLTSFPVGTTELEKESYFRNTCGLLTTRQQIFTIIIEAQTAAGGIFARNPPRQRAAALVWRDAFTGEMFVRWLKWLKD